tara:strand:- start:2145 stop:3209 length:1065 start_codon:yes stop_codon:yes gene_type:complete
MAESASLTFHKQQVDQLTNRVTAARNKVFDDKRILDQAAYHSLTLQKKYETAKDDYQKLIAFDADSPGSVRFEDLSNKRTLNNKAYAAYQDSLNEIMTLQNRLAQSSISLNSTQNALNTAIGSLKFAGADEVDIQLRERKKAFEISQKVPVSIDYFCTEDQTFKQCKSTAKERAERSAIEKGAVVTVSSITKMRDLQIESELVKSEVNANIVKKESVKSSHIMGGDFGGIHYEMIATVEPYLSDTMLNQIKNAITLEVFGKYIAVFSSEKDTETMAGSSQSTNDFLAKLEKENQNRLEATRRLEAQRKADEEAKARHAEVARQEREKEEENALQRRKAEERQLKKKTRAPVLVF